ncbi:MAG: c-type cytochrome [Pirellula sp.]|jgi:putative heme-binding domain-containing protein
MPDILSYGVGMSLCRFFFMLFVSCVMTQVSLDHATGQSVSVGKELVLRGNPAWIWSSDNQSTPTFFRKSIELKGKVKQAIAIGGADNQLELYVNEMKVIGNDEWSQPNLADITKHVREGRNQISMVARNQGGPAGALAALLFQMQDGSVIELLTDKTWKTSIAESKGWSADSFDDSQWSNATEIGLLGADNLPWSGSVNRDAIVSMLGGGQDGEFTPEIASHAKVPEGFKIERIFQVPKPMGSWVALTTDNQGRLIASDQGGAGLFVITPGNETTPTRVQKLPVELSGAQGLLWAFDSLYVVVNGGEKSGLHRVHDTDGDGLVDKAEHCMHLDGGGEHGPHAVILTPDKKSLLVASGNHTKLPNKIVGSKIPTNWNEDHLLPRRWDANGHAAGILAPGGWICEVDPSGKNWTVFSMGYRNQYDIALNQDGELFTYDADMEWDFGSPWYRPTRVCHATSGSEFGWRSGTGKWPTYYEDSLPPTVDIGPGSPTGIVFGQGAKFPARYQKALFILDWTYSTIYSIDMEPDGSSYAGKKSDFVTGSPLPVTDATIGLDGALYFATGGRGTQSDLYRVTYVGKESTAPAFTPNKKGEEARQIRHKLESMHGISTGDSEFALKHLGNSDRFVRYAARIALENQPVSKWRNKVLSIQDPTAAMVGLLALARQGEKSDLGSIIDSLLKLSYDKMDTPRKLMWLRTMQVAFTRLGYPSEQQRNQLVENLDAYYPASSYELDAELVQLLVYLKSSTVVQKTLDMMDRLGPEPIPDWGYLVSRNSGYGGTVGEMLANMPPVRGIHFAFMLRNVKEGWTMAQRRRYFQFFIDAAKKPGGNSYGKFLTQFREDALATCTPAETTVLDSLTGQSLLSAPFTSTPPKGPGRVWTVNEALATIEKGDQKPNYDEGRNLYHATSCSKCHRIAGQGGAVGPDLSTASKKFSAKDMLEAIVEPSKAISDQYGSQQVLTTEGQSFVGRAVSIGEEVYIYTIDADAKPVVIAKADVEEMKESKVSQMPVGLLDQLNEQEVRDLMAYLMSAGDPKSTVYQK